MATDSGLPFLQGTADFGPQHPRPRVYCSVPTKVAMQGDILFSVRAPVGELNIADRDYGIGRGLCAIRCYDRLDSGFAWWTLHSARVNLAYEVTGSTYDAVATEDVANLFISLPSIQEQRAIADYLDRETSKIDALIAEKERLLKLLAEKRRALITQAVTRGLNPDAPMRDSGVEWLGEIPRHWETHRLAFLFHERDERDRPELPLLNVSIHTGVTVREFSDSHIEQVANDFSVYKVAYEDDIAFNKMRMWQGAVGRVPSDGLVSPDYVVAAPIANTDTAYYGELFSITAFSAEAARNSHGIVWDRLRLYWEEFRDIHVPVPPLNEQQEVVKHVTKETEKLDELRAATERTTELLHERRSALISAAVTGQIRAGIEP